MGMPISDERWHAGARPSFNIKSTDLCKGGAKYSRVAAYQSSKFCKGDVS